MTDLEASSAERVTMRGKGCGPGFSREPDGQILRLDLIMVKGGWQADSSLVFL